MKFEEMIIVTRENNDMCFFFFGIYEALMDLCFFNLLKKNPNT